jgi:hypothetical protein
MVIVRLNGGVGNQMFQYAMGRTVAHRRRTSVRFDFRSLDGNARRCYSLGAWNVEAAPASMRDLLSVRIASCLERILMRGRPYYARHTVCEQSFSFDPDALNAPGNCLLMGYWQSEKYFKEIEPILRHEFTLRMEPSAKSQEVARAIQASNSTFLHIRRGDYAADPMINKVHGTCSMRYYEDAVNYIGRAMHDPHLFVFSDEPRWVREHLKLPFPMTVVDHNHPGNAQSPGREHEDLWLMTLCRHAILANSSFSWWGAWLNPERNRIVIAPERWFRSPNNDTRDLIPDNWIRMRS